MRTLMLFAIALCCIPAAAGPLETVFGDAGVVAVSGNGGLTAGVNASGQLALCRWPSPGYHDQLEYRRRPSAPLSDGTLDGQGAVWGLRTGGETLWLTAPAWENIVGYRGDSSQVIEVRSSLPGRELTVWQTLFVHPEQDVLVIQLEVESPQAPDRIYWYVNFSPCTRLIPEVPLADWALDGLNDFAAFLPAGGKTLYHFRPTGPGRADWARARRLAAKQATAAEWSVFGEGVWAACTTPNRLSAFHCGEAHNPSSAFHLASEGALGQGRGAVGQCDAALELKPEGANGKFSATVFCALGRNQEEAVRGLGYADERGADGLLVDTEDYWAKRLGAAPAPSRMDEEFRSLAKRCLLTVAVAADRNSGAIVRNPATQPPLSLDWPRHGAWLDLALDLAGMQSLVDKHGVFYAGCVRTTDARGMPAGSMPSALYTDGTPGTPHVMLETDGVAWTLWSYWRQGMRLRDESARKDFYTGLWQAAEGMAEFLVTWADGRTGIPFHSFDPKQWRDRQSTEQLVTASTGLDAAAAIAQSLGYGYERPEWDRRQRELDNLVRYRCLDERGLWAFEPMLPVYTSDFRIREELLERHFAALQKARGHEAAKLACELALAWQDRPDRLARLRNALAPAVRRALSADADALEAGAEPGYRSDALDAALCYIAIHVSHGRKP